MNWGFKNHRNQFITVRCTEDIKNGSIVVEKEPWRDDDGNIMVGIPEGLYDVLTTRAFLINSVIPYDHVGNPTDYINKKRDFARATELIIKPKYGLIEGI